MLLTKWLTASLLLAVSSLSFAGGGQDKASDLLLRSMGRRFSTNIVAVILQRDPGGDSTYQRVKVTRARDGRVRHTILQPLRMSGIETVDDGEQMRVCLPDKRSMIVQDSAQLQDSDIQERMDLAKLNYELSVVSGKRIAGRSTVCVVATPKATGMAQRRYSLDEKTGYPLRLQVETTPSDTKLIFDTVAIEFPKELPDEVFEIAPLPGTKTIRYSRPKTLTSRAHAEREVGFRPVLPTRFPLGFRIQEMQVNQGEEWKSVVVRLSDGLVRATVYQWKPDGKEVESVEESSSVDINGVRLLLVSDLPAEIRMKLLGAFISQARQAEYPQAINIIGLIDRRAKALEPRDIVRSLGPIDSAVATGSA